MIRVYAAENPVEAYLVKGLLEARGLDAVVLDEHLGDYPSVWVEPSSNVEIARQVIVDFRHTNTMGEIQTGLWCCSTCDENIEPQFTMCWQCGSNRS
jgi:Putative prokaryotic signal transducing protein